MRSDTDVSRYYDRNTPRFLLIGGGGASHSIHRQLWGPGVQNAEEASNYVNLLIAEEIEARLAVPRLVIDLGCGVGGTLLHLAKVFPESTLIGVTISRRQYDLALRIGAGRGLANRCRFVLEDFRTLDLGREADVAIAVESFVHSDTLEHFLRPAAGHLRRGGLLVVADDFLVEDPESLDVEALERVADFQAGWRAPGLCTVRRFADAAAEYRLELAKRVDLTGLIRLGRPRDRVIAALSPVFRRLRLERFPFFGNMIGGNALQIGLRKGFLKYHLLVLRKEGATTDPGVKDHPTPP